MGALIRSEIQGLLTCIFRQEIVKSFFYLYIWKRVTLNSLTNNKEGKEIFVIEVVIAEIVLNL